MPDTILWLNKKRGFLETLLILDSLGGECPQRDFHEHLKTRGSYYNAHLRVRDEMLRVHVLGFKLNATNQKVICLTDEGRRVVALYKQIAEIIHGAAPGAASDAP